MSSNVLSLHYSDDENINNDERQDSNQSLRLLSSISPSKKRASKLSPDKLNNISPNKRVPLEIKSSNMQGPKNPIINSKNLDLGAKRRLLRKNITVTKTGSFTATKIAPSNKSNGLVRYKSLVLDEFHEDEQDDEVENFWLNRKAKNYMFGSEEPDELEGLDKQSTSAQKMLKSNSGISIDDDLEYVPNKPQGTDVFVDEPRTAFTTEDKRKLNEFNAPFTEVHMDKSKMMHEFLNMNESYKNKKTVDDTESTDVKNPYKIEKTDFAAMDAFDVGVEEDRPHSQISIEVEDRITEEQFDAMLEEGSFTIGSIDLDF